MEAKDFKATDTAFAREVRKDIELNLEKFRDPIVLGELTYRLLEERENTNRLLKNILAKLEALEAKGLPTAQIHTAVEDALLPEIDEQIMDFINQSGKVTAEEVRMKFNYKGKNAACARLNRLCDMNLLHKSQVGKKVYFFPLK